MTVSFHSYAHDKQASSEKGKLGRGCISNALAESHFSIVKGSLLQGKLHLRPMDFICIIHSSVIARIISGELGLPQTARCRKLTKGDVLQRDDWRKKGRKPRKGGMRGKYFSSDKGNKGVNQKKRYETTIVLLYYSKSLI